MFSEKVTGNFESALDNFAQNLKEQVAPVGAQAMAQVVYDDARNLVSENTGRLKNAIYQVHSKDKSVHGRSEYHVSWNHSKAPHGHLIEFGTSRAPAHPFLYPAFSHNKGTLPGIANNAMAAKLKEIT